MKPLPSDEELVQALRDEVQGIRAAWLFGSAAHGSLHAKSDIDVAVWRREPLDGLERFDTANRLALRWGRDVDLLDFMRLSPTVQVQVLSGRRLFDDDPVAGLMEAARSLREWQDWQRWQRPQRQALAARLMKSGMQR